jgi:hypothetical protein
MPSAVASRSSRGGGGATLCGRQVQQPPLLLRLLPLPVPHGPVERRVERHGVLGGEFAFVPSPEERGPRLAVVRVEARVGALLVAHRLDDLVNGGVEGGARWRRRDRDAAGAQTPSSGCAEVGRRRWRRWRGGLGRILRMWPARRGRPRYIGGRALTRLAVWLAVHRRQLIQRAEDDTWGRRRCAKDETIRTTTALSRR